MRDIKSLYESQQRCVVLNLCKCDYALENFDEVCDWIRLCETQSQVKPDFLAKLKILEMYSFGFQ